MKAAKVSPVKAAPDAFKERLLEAERTGEIVTIRYTAGRRYRYHFTATGAVDGFLRRPREAEKVKIARSDSFVRWEVPLKDIDAIEAAVERGARV
jgi:hypothetical protein